MVVAVLGTAVYTQLEADTPYWILGLALYVRGLGLGSTMMPAMAAAYQTLSRETVPKATSMINIIRTVGGSFGTAILTVVLERRIVANVPGASGELGSLSGGDAARAAEPLSHAFGQPFWWACALTAIALIPAFFLPRHPPSAARLPLRRETSPERELATSDQGA